MWFTRKFCFVVADVPHPILGADFFSHFNLIIPLFNLIYPYIRHSLNVDIQTKLWSPCHSSHPHQWPCSILPFPPFGSCEVGDLQWAKNCVALRSISTPRPLLPPSPHPMPASTTSTLMWLDPFRSRTVKLSSIPASTGFPRRAEAISIRDNKTGTVIRVFACHWITRF